MGHCLICLVSDISILFAINLILLGLIIRKIGFLGCTLFNQTIQADTM